MFDFSNQFSIELVLSYIHENSFSKFNFDKLVAISSDKSCWLSLIASTFSMTAGIDPIFSAIYAVFVTNSFKTLLLSDNTVSISSFEGICFNISEMLSFSSCILSSEGIFSIASITFEFIFSFKSVTIFLIVYNSSFIDVKRVVTSKTSPLTFAAEIFSVRFSIFLYIDFSEFSIISASGFCSMSFVICPNAFLMS